MCFLYSIFSKKNKEKGFSLIEVLTAIGLATFATLVSQALFQMSIRNFNVQNKVTVMMDEQQLYEILTKTIGDSESCKKNLVPTATAQPSTRPTNGYVGFYGQHHLKGVGGVHELHLFKNNVQKSTTPLVSIGPFMQYLNIVKMDLVSAGNPDPAQSTFPTAQNTEVNRRFTVYYKYKQGRVKIDSNAGATCTSVDTSGCYRLYCELTKYKLTSATVNECEATCTRPNWGGGGSADIKCADGTSAVKVQPDGTTLFGCGTTKANSDGTTAFGFNAGKAAGGSNNTFMGVNAGKNIPSGKGQNTLIGASAGENTQGQHNTFIGRTAGKNAKGGNNTFIGTSAGNNILSGGSNVFIGQKAGRGLPVDIGGGTNASTNIGIGRFAGAGIKTGGSNVFIGNQAGYNGNNNNTSINQITGSENTLIGSNAGSAITGGSSNVAIGNQAGKKLTTGTQNIFIGKEAGRDTIEKGRNTFIGTQAGMENTAEDNIFIGTQAGYKNRDGGRNTIVGTWAGSANISGDNNTFFGYNAGHNTTGDSNTFIGENAGKDNTVGGDNIFIGKEAGEENTTGDDNIFIGKEAGEENTTGDDNIFIGNEAGEHNKGGISKTGDYQLNIGNLIFGRMPSTPPGSTINFFPPTGSGTNKYLKDGNNQEEGLVIYGNLYVKGKAFANCGTNGTCQETSISLGTPSSSKIHKKNITPFVEFEKSLIDITTTPLFTYEYKDDHPNHKRMGIIAEDLPPHLQIKDQYEPVKPDWVSIYGTFWASIKALFNKVTNLTKSILRLNSITSSLKVNLYEVKEKLEDLHGVKDRLEVLEKETQFLRKQNKELKKKIKALSKKGVSQ